MKTIILLVLAVILLSAYAQKEAFEQQIRDRRPRVENAMAKLDKYGRHVATETYDISVREFFKVIFADTSAYWEAKTRLGASSPSLNNWNNIPCGITEREITDKTLECIAHAPERLDRVLDFTIKVKGGGGWFNPIPETCTVTDAQYAFVLSPEEIVVETESRSHGVPFADTFFIRNGFFLKDLDGGKRCEFLWRTGTEIVSFNLFSGQVKSTADSEIDDFRNILLPLIREKVNQYVANRK